MDVDPSVSDQKIENYQTYETLKAETIYVILRRSSHVSRSLRVQWFLQHLNTKIRIVSHHELDEDNSETFIVSVIPQDHPKNWTVENSHKFEYLVALTSNVIFLGEVYRLVYCLDISPSVSTIDIQHGEVLLDVIIEALQKTIKLLVKPFQIPGSSHIFTADIYITVIAHTPFYISPAQQVLVQGWKISDRNINEFLGAVLRQLKFIENEVALVSGSVHEQFEHERKKSFVDRESHKSTEGIFKEDYSENNILPNIAMVSPGSGFLNLLRYGMLALKLLPVSNFSNLVVITDGMIIMPDSDTLDSVLNHMRYNDIACYFLHVGSQFHPRCGFGSVPYAEIMQLISVATSGAYMQFPSQQKPVNNVDAYHHNFLTWTLKKKSVVLDLSTPYNPKDGEWYITNRHFYGNRGPQLIMKKYLESDINVTLYGVLACRIREGFIVKDLYIRESELILNFVLPWTNHIYVDYTLSCQWPTVNAPCHYVINIQAPYEFLHDISCRMKMPIKSPFRQALIARFWRSLKSFAQSDLLLSHLESFMNNISSYYLPESLKNGMPLYNLPVNGQPNIISSDVGYIQFGNIWRPACLLNNNLWQKWFHADRVGVIFKHDEPLNLFAQNFEARSIKYTGLMCRQATNTLFSFLKSYCSFVLIENHSYIKFLQPNESGTEKNSFMVIRSIVKPPYAVLHVAFLHNIPGRVRSKLLKDFKRSLNNLKIHRLSVANDCYNNIFGTDKENVLTNTYDVQVNCCILLDKPLEKILIRYEQIPKEFRTVVFPDGTEPLNKTSNNLSSSCGLITTLSRYLHHRRWLWRANVAQNIFLPLNALEKVLSALIKTRLQEGFFFAHYSSGICNMVLEVKMKGARIEKDYVVDGVYYDYRNDTDTEDGEQLQSCIIQYLLFAPKTIIVDNDSEDNSNSHVRVIELVTECWIEPLHGVITDCPPVRNYMSNLQYHQLPDAIWGVDAKCISALFTFEYLRLICGDPSIEAPDSVQDLLSHTSSLDYWPNVAPFEDQRISQIPFAFSLPNLLCQCTQDMLNLNLFSIDILDKFEVTSASNRLLLELLYNHLTTGHNKELIISGKDALYLFKNLRRNGHNIKKRNDCVYNSKSSLHSDGTGLLPTGSDWDRMTSWAVGDYFQPVSATHASETNHNSTNLTSNDSSQQSSVFDFSSISCLEEADWLKWKCFIRFTSRNQCLVTVIPESLDVVKRIVLNQKDTFILESYYHNMCSNINDEMSASVIARNDSCSFYTTCNSSCKDLKDENDGFEDRTPVETTFRLRASTWDPVRGTYDLTGADDRLRTNSVGAKVMPFAQLYPKRSFDFDSRDRLSENVIRVAKYVPLILPVYVCDCSLYDVMEYLIWKNKNSDDGKPKNTFMDSSSINSENHLEEQCMSIKVAFRKYFILSLFKSLHLGYNISVHDVEQAFAKCDTSVVTIDITEYLKIVCRHLKNSSITSNSSDEKISSRISTYFTSSSVCNELRCIHRLIKKKFLNILTLDFKPVSSKPEFFYFFPSWTKESKPSSVGMLSPGVVENSLDEHVLPPTSSSSILGLGTWETYKESVNSEDNACTSLLSNMDSDSLNEVSNESLIDDTNPFFLRIDCKIQSENVANKCSVTVIPTCICDILKCLDRQIDINISNLRITLELLCLTSPYADSKKKVSKSSQTKNEFCNNEFKNVTETLSTKDGQIPKLLEYLPDHQYNALNSCISQMKWLMEDEIVTFMLDVTPVIPETLKVVCAHIESSPNAATCFIEKVPLSFVYDKEDKSINNFLKNLPHVKISNYHLKKLENMYYLIKNASERHTSFVDEYSDVGDISKMMTNSIDLSSEDQEMFNQVFSSDDSIFTNDTVKEICTDFVNARHGSLTDGEDDISQTMQTTIQWILNRESSTAELPNFWLIATINENYVTVYFHCRFLEIKKKEIEDYVLIRENVIRNIKDLCKVVNQKMLLDSLHETRTCNQLLVSDPQQDEENTISDLMDQPNHTFLPGCFACPVVWETKFILHPRLKVNPLKGAVSRGTQALCSALSGFSILNRKNLFVYQDMKKNVFYLRLYESFNGGSKHDSEETSSSSFSRSSSFTSLSRKQFEDQLPFLLDKAGSCSKSFSDASETNAIRNDDFITLKVYGITDPGKDVKNELVQVLQNRLDDAVLDVISIMLKRNPLCKLLSEDVHFIQKPNHLPNNVLQFAVHERVTNHLYTFLHFVRQNVKVFATFPKYSDPRPSFHFQDYSIAEDSPMRINECDMFLYNQNETYDSKAIACLALVLVDPSGALIKCEERPETIIDLENDKLSLEEINTFILTEKITEEPSTEGRIRIEFRIWKQGKVNMETLNSKLSLAIRHALWEFALEKNLLPYPIFLPDTDSLHNIYHFSIPKWMSFGIELNVPSVKEWEITLPIRSNVHLIFKELNNIFPPFETVCYGFYKCCNLHGSHLQSTEVFKPCVTFENMQHTTDTCLIIGRNPTYSQNYSEYSKSFSLDTTEVRLQRSPSSCQENGNSSMAKQKFIFIKLAKSKIKMYIYNWSKDKFDTLTKLITNFSDWLRGRSSLLTSIVEQKLGLFFNSPLQRLDLSESVDMNTMNLESLLRFPMPKKCVGGIRLNEISDNFKDTKLTEIVRNKIVEKNPFFHHVKQLREIMNIDRKSLHKSLHNMWLSKSASSSMSVNEEMLNSFLLYGRIIHYCLTPLLFSPRWRFATAATRDHSLSLKAQSQNDELIFCESDETWHKVIRSNFVSEYKQYLNSMGFHSIRRPDGEFPMTAKVKLPQDSEITNIHYMQKFLLGGVLLYELYFSKPFFNTKLYALEYARLDAKTSSLGSQFTVSFLDECDRIKFHTHLHSFTYDYHLRCLHQFVTDQQPIPLLASGYHIVNFLEDFMTYYPKAPNYARSLVIKEFVIVNEVPISPTQLFNYLLLHRKDYNMNIFCMSPEVSSNDTIIEENECILIRNKSTSAISYKDMNDQQQTEDFDIVIIISHLNDNDENCMKFQIYIVITSRRELYPKVEPDQKIGKFRAVSISVDNDDQRSSIADYSGSSCDSKEPIRKRKNSHHHLEIKSELVNYMGYYSSHEEALQTVMMDEVEDCRKYVQWIVTQGAFDCKTQILWDKLLSSSPTPLSYHELQDLLHMADVHEISTIDEQLKAILHQPMSWLLSFFKTLQSETCHMFSSPGGTTQELLILNPQYVNGFLMIVLDLLTSTCTMSLVYRRGTHYGDDVLQSLFEQIINNLCFHLWVDAF